MKFYKKFKIFNHISAIVDLFVKGTDESIISDKISLLLPTEKQYLWSVIRDVKKVVPLSTTYKPKHTWEFSFT